MTTGKYNNNKITVDQIRFDSQEESRFYELLKRMKANGEILNFELQPKYLLQPAFKYNGKTVRAITYTADFLIYHNDGTEEVVDIKGMETQQGLMRRKMFWYKYPDLKLTWLSRSIKYGDENGWIEYDALKRKRKQR